MHKCTPYSSAASVGVSTSGRGTVRVSKFGTTSKFDFQDVLNVSRIWMNACWIYVTVAHFRKSKFNMCWMFHGFGWACLGFMWLLRISDRAISICVECFKELDYNVLDLCNCRDEDFKIDDPPTGFCYGKSPRNCNLHKGGKLIFFCGSKFVILLPKRTTAA